MITPITEGIVVISRAPISLSMACPSAAIETALRRAGLGWDRPAPFAVTAGETGAALTAPVEVPQALVR